MLNLECSSEKDVPCFYSSEVALPLGFLAFHFVLILYFHRDSVAGHSADRPFSARGRLQVEAARASVGAAAVRAHCRAGGATRHRAVVDGNGWMADGGWWMAAEMWLVVGLWWMVGGRW